MNQKTLYRSIAIVLAAGSLAACGGGGDTSNTTPLSTTTVGTLTGFGSIYVNGTRFDTSRAVYKVDGDDAFDDGALGVGMKVKVKGTKSPDGRTGTADSVYYDDDLDGPIENLNEIDTDTKSFTVFGQLVIVDAKRTVFDDLRFDILANGQVVEISGYYEGERLIATRVELEDDDDDDHEVKGVIANYVGTNRFDLLLPSGTLVPVITDGNTSYDLDTGLSNGLYVEVEGLWNGSALVADEIDDADDLLDDDDDDVELKGPLSGNSDSGWLVKGIPVILTSATEYEPSRLKDNLLAGMMVEVEGYMQGGALIAEEIEAYEDDDIEIEAPVLSVIYNEGDPKSGTVTLQFPNEQTLEVITNSATLFKDDSDWDLNDDGSFSLDELASRGEFVEIEAYLAGDGSLIATTISREDEISDTKVEALVEDFEKNQFVTVLGVTWTVGSETEYEVDDGDTGASAFWETIEVGMEIEIEDEAPANGIADKLELDDSPDDDD
jgi:hypothetical protein